MDSSLSLLLSVPVMLLKQEALAREKYLKNSIAKDICVVAKTLPFVVEFGCSAPTNFQGATIVATLCYDNEFNSDFKPVDFVKSQPMNYKCFISEDGLKCTAEVRITALSSQHEDALFRVKFHVDFADTENAGVFIFTEPMRVVSKPSQVFKQKRARKTSELSAPASPVHTSPSSPSSATSSNVGKRSAPSSSEVSNPNPSANNCRVEDSNASTSASTTMELLLATMNRLEQQQRQQQDLLNQILLNHNSLSAQKSAPVACDSETDLETAFEEFVSAYERVPTEDRPHKIRRVVFASNSNQKFMEIVRACNANNAVAVSAVGSNTPSAGANLEECFCLNCPHKRELSSWDRLYEEFLHSPEHI